MDPTEEQIKELMTTVACSVCGAHYQHGDIDVLGHRDGLWFLRVSCASCATQGLVAAMVKSPEEASAQQPAAAPLDDGLDRARAPGPVTPGDVAAMHRFLDSFDGDFQSLFGAGPNLQSRRPAA